MQQLLGIYKYFRPETESWEDVQEEIFKWEAVYTDGTVLKQFDDNGRFHQFREIDQSKLRFFRMYSSLVPQKFVIDFKPGMMKLIHGYKVINLVAPHSNAYFRDAFGRFKLYFFGYEVEGQKVINVIMSDGSLITTDNVENIMEGLIA